MVAVEAVPPRRDVIVEVVAGIDHEVRRVRAVKPGADAGDAPSAALEVGPVEVVIGGEDEIRLDRPHLGGELREHRLREIPQVSQVVIAQFLVDKPPIPLLHGHGCRDAPRLQKRVEVLVVVHLAPFAPAAIELPVHVHPVHQPAPRHFQCRLEEPFLVRRLEEGIGQLGACVPLGIHSQWRVEFGGHSHKAGVLVAAEGDVCYAEEPQPVLPRRGRSLELDGYHIGAVVHIDRRPHLRKRRHHLFGRVSPFVEMPPLSPEKAHLLLVPPWPLGGVR